MSAIHSTTEPRYILLVEDDLAKTEVLKLAITTETPYLIQCAESAEAALLLISSTTPDLLLLDDRLPGMNGLELYDYLHSIPELSTVPAILLSAHPHSTNEVESHHLTTKTRTAQYRRLFTNRILRSNPNEGIVPTKESL